MPDKTTPAYHVLIVDDKPREGEAIKAAVEQAVPDCDFTQASDIAAAKKALSEVLVPYDLAIIDMVLEHGTWGLDLFGPNRMIHPWVQRTRVILLTAYPSWETACEAYEAGASVCLSKLDPTSTAKLQQRARQLLVGESTRRQSLAQMQADEAFVAHYDEWCKQYRGKYLLVRGEQVLAIQDNMPALSRALEAFPEDERPDIGFVKVPRARMEQRDA